MLWILAYILQAETIASDKAIPDFVLVILTGLFGGVGGVVLKGLWDLKFKKIDDRAEVHKLLLGELTRIQGARNEFEEDLDVWKDKYWEERGKKHDANDRASAYLFKVHECADYIEMLLTAEKCLADSFGTEEINRARNVIKQVRNMRGNPANLGLLEKYKIASTEDTGELP